MSRNPSIILKKLGLSEDDLKTSQLLFQEMPPPPPFSCERGHKVEVLLGYSVTRLKRSKALKVLGTSEEKIEEENSKNLGALGAGGRRRSFMIADSESETESEHSSNSTSQRTVKRRRRGNSFQFNLRKKSKNDGVNMRRIRTRDQNNLTQDNPNLETGTRERILEEQMNCLKVALNDAKTELTHLTERVAYLERRQNKKGAISQH